jgi:hypothetical protein
MARRKAKPPAQNKKPPLLPPWAWQLLVQVSGRAIGELAFRFLKAASKLAETLWP